MLPSLGDPILAQGGAIYGRALDRNAASMRASNSLTTMPRSIDCRRTLFDAKVIEREK
jgi:hypothetical protein